MDDLSEELNPEQKDAVFHGKGPLLIVAGAGTGKTKVITHRIAHLVGSKQARPEEILAVTFTEKAAHEMEERVDLLIPYGYSFVEISTFNSFGERVLRNHAHELGYYLDFKLLDEVEQAIFFRENLFRFPLKYYRPSHRPTKHIQELLTAIRRLKQEDIHPEEYLRFARGLKREAVDDADRESALKHHEIALVYAVYQKLLRQEGNIDFEDQAALVVELFRERPAVLREFQRKYRYILVDEFQDTNYVQFELLKLLTGAHDNLTVVGDDDQSIFRFRGASLSNIQNFRGIYPHARKIVLTKNYRSTQSILDASHQLIRHNNPDRLEVRENIDKTLHAVNPSHEKSIHLLQFDTLSHQCDEVGVLIRSKLEEGFRYGDIAILVRRNADADPFLRALNVRDIPFRFSGSRGLYSREEVKILVSFIKALTDFDDSRSLFHLALSEVYGVDAYDLTLATNYAHKKHHSLHMVFRMIHEDRSPVAISAAGREAVRRLFGDLIAFVRQSAVRNAGQILYLFLEKSGYLGRLIEEPDREAELKIKNIRVFFDKVKHFSELSTDGSIQAFASHLELLEDVGDNPASAEAELEEDAVNVLTVHKAKGLEFPVVLMVSLIADRFPGRERVERIPAPNELIKDDSVPGSFIQEERRLFYVGMTRAKQQLYLIWARDYGMKRPKKVSPFVLEALNLARAPEAARRLSALEEIRRYAPRSSSAIRPSIVSEKTPIVLSFLQVDHYLTCPLMYKYHHVMRIPVLPHHNLVYGRVLHGMIHLYLKNKQAGIEPSEEDFIRLYRDRWINEGFLSREHEEQRRTEGERALRRFFQREEKSAVAPWMLEKNFRWSLGDIRFAGRWDRVDREDEGAVIIDFKAGAVKNQREADKRTRESLQMDLYALSFLRSYKIPLLETRLHFLESDIIGHARKTDGELRRAEDRIREAQAGIMAEDFAAKPDWNHCNFCAFKSICPSSFAF